MDTLRGQFGSFDDDTRDEDYGEDDISREAPPSPVGQDERRMQVRAYNHWASLLQDRNFPSIEDLDPESLPDFGPHSVLLDFTGGIENPAIQYLGDSLAQECGTDDKINTLDDVPSRSLLSRITDHYMQILANQAPIGFEAEFVNQRSATILYRGILLPFSSDNDTIDFIYGVINWKEMADQLTTDELLLEIDQALDSVEGEDDDAVEAPLHSEGPVTDWADGPSASVDEDAPAEEVADVAEEPVLEVSQPEESKPAESSFASLGGGDFVADEDEDEPISEFVLPDIGDADEEDTIDQAAYASLAPAGEDEDDEGGSLGLAGMRKKPAKKPLDLSLSHAIGPVDGDGELEDDLPMPAFGQEDDRFANLMGSDLSDDGESDEDADDWSASLGDALAEPAPLPGDEMADEPLELAEEAVEIADEPVSEDFGEDATSDESFDEQAPEELEVAPLAEEPLELDAPLEEPAPVAEEQAATEIVLPSMDQDPSELGLYDTLAEARELAQVANASEERSRTALYDAVARAYDVSLAAEDAPEDFEELVSENGLTMQDRAPMTPVVKLVFGADYNKTRVAEYATVLTHAHRMGIERGKLSDYLSKVEGGLKGVVQSERRLRREEAGKDVDPADEVRSALAKKLRKLEPQGFDSLEADGAEFGVVMIRRLESGEIVVLGEVSDDIPLVEKVARKLVA